jgi:hypothetical protein
MITLESVSIVFTVESCGLEIGSGCGILFFFLHETVKEENRIRDIMKDDFMFKGELFFKVK